MRTAALLLFALFSTNTLIGQATSSDPSPALRTRVETKPDTDPVLRNVAEVFRSYLRDIAETRFSVRSTISEFGNGPSPHKIIRKKHDLRVKGIRVSDGPGFEASFKADRGTFWVQTTPDYAVIFDAVVVSQFDLQLQQLARFDPPEMQDELMTLRFRPAEPCVSFTKGTKKFIQWQVHEWCGEGFVRIDSQNMLPVSAGYHALGLPIHDGEKHLDDYQVEVQFQLLRDSNHDARLLPRKSTATFLTEKGKTVVENEYDTVK